MTREPGQRPHLVRNPNEVERLLQREEDIRIKKLVGEIDRLRAELAEHDAMVARLLAACDEADKAVEQDNYSDRRALSTGLIRRLLAGNGGARDG